ncbi:MAG: catalase/peroxidase HPI [Psittacicella sp.]
MSKCPVMHDAHAISHPVNGPTLTDWWPNRLKVELLHQHAPVSNPMGTGFDYIAEFNTINLEELEKDIVAVMYDSKDWWPADYGNYGPLFIRMSWHDAGTYRTMDGRGGANTGNQRFAPINSWPDNVSLDKARRLLWPIKQKYGRRLSWADLIIFTGTIALKEMGLPIVGFAGGREDIYAPEIDSFWGTQTEWMGDLRGEDGKLDDPLAAVVMGLIYVNPEGPQGKPDPLAAATDIRETFGRMAMDDEETVALIAGGHTFGKTHGAGPADHVGREPEAAPIEDQGMGWRSTYKSGVGADAITSGLEVTWTNQPTKWDMGFFENLFKYEWALEKSPAGAWQWVAAGAEKTAPHAHHAGEKVRVRMLTTDLSLMYDPEYRRISEDFLANPEKFTKAFARAWFKLTHRDVGPVARYHGTYAPTENFIWQDIIPANTNRELTSAELNTIKEAVKATGLTVRELVFTAWASAFTFRGSDYRGGANGARIRLAPQNTWEVNAPEQTNRVIGVLEGVQAEFAKTLPISLADLIVLAGNLGIELAAKNAGFEVEVPFNGGRGDAAAEQTDAHAFAPLEPLADGFRNFTKNIKLATTSELLIDKAQLLTLSAPEMTVLFAGMRMMDTNYDNSKHGVFTQTPGALTTDYFVNLLNMDYKWEKVEGAKDLFNVADRKTGEVKFTATAVDLIFGSNSQLRAIAEVYGADDAKAKFVEDFVKAWVKVMNLDRFDLHK